MANTNLAPDPAAPKRSRLGASIVRIVKVAVLAAVALWPFAVFEMVIEFLGIAPPRAAAFSVWTRDDDVALQDEGGKFRAAEAWLWEPRPGARIESDPINDDACRGPRLSKEKGTALRIATFGDSSTFGLHVEESECFARQIETKLRARGEAVEVINFGCVGYSARQAYERWKGQGREWDPDVVIVAVGAVNEHWPAELSDSEKMRLLGTPGRRIRAALERYSAWRWLDGALAPDARRELTPTPGRAPPRVPLDEFERILTEWNSGVKEDGGRFIVLSPPRRRDAEQEFDKLLPYTHVIERVVAAQTIDWVDVYTSMRAADEADPVVARSPSKSKLFLDGFHPSVAGHDQYAELVVRTMIEKGWTKRSSDREVPR